MKTIAHYVEGRLFEWVMSIPIVILGFMLLAWPKITTAPAFHLFAWALPSEAIALSLIVSGFACIAALLANGSSLEIGPRVRSWSALLRGVLWLQFAISTLQASLEQGFPFTVQPFWFTFAVAEIWVAYRAVLDVRTPL